MAVFRRILDTAQMKSDFLNRILKHIRKRNFSVPTVPNLDIKNKSFRVKKINFTIFRFVDTNTIQLRAPPACTPNTYYYYTLPYTYFMSACVCLMMWMWMGMDDDMVGMERVKLKKNESGHTVGQLGRF